jgi:hypothetical protein
MSTQDNFSVAGLVTAGSVFSISVTAGLVVATDLTVRSIVRLGSALSTTGNLHVNGEVSVGSTGSVRSTFSVRSHTNVGSALYVSHKATLMVSASAREEFGFGGFVSIVGDTELYSTLSVIVNFGSSVSILAHLNAFTASDSESRFLVTCLLYEKLRSNPVYRLKVLVVQVDEDRFQLRVQQSWGDR